MIELRQVSFKRDYTYILDKINLSIQHGELIGILGANGVGKSTLLQLFMGLLQPTEGSIHYSFSTSNNPCQIKRHFGLVLEDTFLYDDLSVRENLEFFASLYQIEKSKERIDELLDVFDMQWRSNQRISTLSKGLKKRVALMRGIVHKPTIWLLDEPFDGLDSLSTQILSRQMLRHVKSGGVVIFVSHITEHIFHIATRGILLDKKTINTDCTLPSEKTALFNAYHELFHERDNQHVLF